MLHSCDGRPRRATVGPEFVSTRSKPTTAAGVQRLDESQFDGALAPTVVLSGVPLRLRAAARRGQTPPLGGPSGHGAAVHRGGGSGSPAGVMAKGGKKIGAAGVAASGPITLDPRRSIGGALSIVSVGGTGSDGTATRSAGAGSAGRRGAASAGLATSVAEKPSAKAVLAAAARFCVPDPRGPLLNNEITTAGARGGVTTTSG